MFLKFVVDIKFLFYFLMISWRWVCNPKYILINNFIAVTTLHTKYIWPQNFSFSHKKCVASKNKPWSNKLFMLLQDVFIDVFDFSQVIIPLK